MRSWMVVVALPLIVSCGREWYTPLDADGTDTGAGVLDAGVLDAGANDAGAVDARAADAGAPPPDLGSVFRDVVEHAPVNTATREFGTSMTADGLTLVFSSYDTGRGEPLLANLYLGRRASLADLFSDRRLLRDASTDANEAEPTWVEGGAAIYFDRVDDTQIWRCVVASDRCTDAAPIASLAGFEGPDLAVGETHLVVSSGGDLFEAARPAASDPWPTPTRIDELAGLALGGGYPSLREDGLEIFWERGRDATAEIWRATRPTLDAPFENVERVTFVGLVGPAGDPDISADGRLLVFVANPESGGTGEFDVYTATRTP